MAQLICENISLGYNSKAILKKLNFKINKGEYLCIIGENGSGKTTLMKTILRLIPPLEGKIYTDDGLLPDEIGYLPVDKQGANLFFQLIAKRYEKHSTIITTNMNFSKWGEVFSDNILANAILDRLLHHSSVININGNSYRIKDKIKQFDDSKETH